jgi:hypothetical protein
VAFGLQIQGVTQQISTLINQPIEETPMKKFLAYALILEITVVCMGMAVEKTMGLSDRLTSAQAMASTQPAPQLAAMGIPVPDEAR